MQLINNKIYFSWNELASFVSEGTLKSNQFRKSENWNFIKDENDNRISLLEYAPLPVKFKTLIKQNLCNGICPYELHRAEKLKSYLVLRNEDVEALQSFRLKDGNHLTNERREQYTEACKYMALLNLSPGQIKRELGYSTAPEFYKAVGALIKTNKVRLATSYHKLRDIVKEYNHKGAVALIHGNYCNSNHLKVGVDQQRLLEDLFAKHNQFDASQVARIFNHAAVEQGWKTICSRTALNYFNKYQTGNERYGYQEWRNIADLSVKRKRPSAPNMLWVGDATPYELFYQERETNAKGHSVVKHQKRLVIYAVIDAYNDYVVGFSIGYTESAELAKMAWKNACTWQGVLPHQIKTDNFSSKELASFYTNIARYFTPSEVGNARDKVIEPFWARLFKQVTKLHSNFSGHNITAKQQPNREYLDKIKQSFPEQQEVISQIDLDILYWNRIVREKTGLTLEQEYWQGDHSRDRVITDEKRLMLFGKKNTRLNGFTNSGIEFIVNGEERTYNLLTDEFWNTLGTKYQVIYDEDDFSKILVTAQRGEKEQRFVLSESAPIPMAYMDMTEGDRTRLNNLLDFKEQRKNRLLESQLERQRVLKRLVITDDLEAEAIAQTLFTTGGKQKGANYEAQNVLKNLGTARIPKNSKQKALVPVAKAPVKKAKIDISPQVDENREIRVLGSEHRNK